MAGCSHGQIQYLERDVCGALLPLFLVDFSVNAYKDSADGRGGI